MLRKIAVDSFMREDVPCGDIHIDFHEATQELTKLLNTKGRKTEKRLRLYGKCNCLRCGEETSKFYEWQKFCSAKCSSSYRYGVHRGTNRRATGDHLPRVGEGESPDRSLRRDGEDSYAKDA